jgi:folate-binding protein YgfZ
MAALLLHEFHRSQGAAFAELNGQEAVADYGNATAEEVALRSGAGVIDLSFRGRLCLLGADRVKFLNGQVTNNVKDLRVGEGCYAALVSARGKIQSDLQIYILENEILLDFEPGLTATVQQWLEKYIIAEDVQVVNVGPHYGLLSAQGPDAASAIKNFSSNIQLPEKPHGVAKWEEKNLGEVYVVNHPRGGSAGYDIFVPSESMAAVAGNLAGARWCGWRALEATRIKAGIPRFGADMDDTNLAPEALGAEAISYSKGCYIGQEVIARVRTYGQVAKALRGLRLPENLAQPPSAGDKLFIGDKEVGHVTSVAGDFALGYVRREANQAGTELALQTGGQRVAVKVIDRG